MQKNTVPSLIGCLLIIAVALVSCSQEHATVTVTQYTDPSIITGIAKYDGYIYCATQGGLVRWDIDAREYALITTAEGLISNVLTDIIVDGDNLLWISSREGITSFDGMSWKRYGIAQGLPSTYVTDLAVDHDGILWVSTGDGAANWDGSRFKLLAEPDSPGRKPITAVFFDGGNNIWISTENDGLYNKVEGEWTHRPHDNGRVAQNWDLNMWIYNDEIVGYWNGLSFTQFPTIEYMSSIGSRHIGVSDNRMWFFTLNGVHASRGTRDWLHFTEKEGLASVDVTAGLVISDNEVYAGTTNGLSVIRNGVVENYIVPNTPVGFNTISVAADSLDRIWLGTWETGTNLFDKGSWFVISGDETINKRLLTVRSFAFGPDDEIAFNTTTGTLFNTGDAWRFETRATGMSGDDVRCGLYDRNGNYWAGTSGGICMYENGEWRRFREYHGLPSEDIWACTLDTNGVVWFGTTKGIVSIENEQVKDHTAQTGLDSLDVRSACTVGATVWFGTADGKVAVYDGESWNVYGNNMLGTDRAIFAMTAEPSGAVWLGTDGDGIIRILDGAVEQYTVDDGLPFDVIRSLEFHNGTLWMACYGGAASLVRTMVQ